MTWNTMYSSSKENVEVAINSTPHEVIGLIDSCNKFTKAWKQVNTDKDKIDILFNLDEKYLKNIFGCDIPMNVLDESVRIFSSTVCRENLEQVLVIMTSFTLCKRFDLSLKFFSKSDRQHLTELFRRLEELDSSVQELKTFYKV